MKLNFKKREDGSSLFVAMFVCVVVGIILAGYLVLTSNRFQMTVRSSDWNAAIRLLVVDDDAVSRHAMVFALRKVFREPDLAGGGEQALGLAEKNAYDVIFLDIDMPGMDGFELCEKIRATTINKKTPIVFVTSHDNLESRAKLVTKGAQDLIGKPYLPAEITLKGLQLSLYGRLKNGPMHTSDTDKAETPDVPALAALDKSPAAI